MASGSMGTERARAVGRRPAGPREHGDLGELEHLAPAVPGLELRVLVGAEQQHRPAAQALQRVHRVAGMAGRELAFVDRVARLALEGEPAAWRRGAPRWRAAGARYLGEPVGIHRMRLEAERRRARRAPSPDGRCGPGRRCRQGCRSPSVRGTRVGARAAAAAARRGRAPVPGASSRNSHCGAILPETAFRSSMLKMVMAKPMQLAMVSAEPTSSRGALCAFSAENCGESPTTTTPQNSRKARNTGVGAWNSERRQHAAHAGGRELRERDRARCPRAATTRPPPAQPRQPAAITANAHSGTFSVADRRLRDVRGEDERHERPERVQLPHVAEVAERRRAEPRASGR